MTTESSSITVSGLHITECEVAAVAGDGRHRRRVFIRVAALEPEAWEGAVTALAADAALMASVLDGQRPPTRRGRWAFKARPWSPPRGAAVELRLRDPVRPVRPP